MAKKKKNTSSKGGFSVKEFLIMHVEKLVFAMVALLSFGLIGLGFMAKPYSSTKTPDSLRDLASQVSRQLKENHWDEIAKSQPPIVTNFKEASGASRKPIFSDPIAIFPKQDISGNRRGDPTVLAPTKLEAKYYFGPIAVSLKAKTTDPLDKLEDAKKHEEKPKDNKRNKGMGFGGDMAGGGYGSEGGAGFGGDMAGGGGMGPGMGMGMGTGPNAARMLAQGYDRGFVLGMRTFFDPNAAMGGMPGGTGSMMGGPGGAAPGGTGTGTMGTGTTGSGQPGTGPVEPKKIPYAITGGFTVVTALAPHGEMEEAYKKEFAEVPGFMDGRDTPNYVGFEVQRVEINVENASREIQESEWQNLATASNESFKTTAKSFIGTCSEVCLPNWVEPNISMPIPPMLQNDFRKYAGHSEIPSTIPEPRENEGEPVDAPAGGMGYGGYGGDMAGGMGFGGEGSAGMGYGGDMAGGMGYGGDMAGGMGFGGEGSAGMGYGGDMAGGMGYGGGMTGPGVSLPKRLPSTKYKLVRFFDISPPAGKTFRYRVRLLMYDPNYPEYVVFQPRSNTLKPDAVSRVQKLLAKEPKEAKPSSDQVASMKPPVKRTSKRETEWSAPSDIVFTSKPPAVHVGYSETTPPKPELVVVELERNRAVYVPAKYSIEAGNVMAAFKKEKGREAPEIVHPVSKIIKILKDYLPGVKDYVASYAVTLVDSRGLQSLKATAGGKDLIKTGIEIVTYDSGTGQLMISREFDDFTNFNLHTRPDQLPVGPLGGGLKVDTGSAYGGGGGYGGAEGGGGGFGGGGKSMGMGVGGP